MDDQDRLNESYSDVSSITRNESPFAAFFNDQSQLDPGNKIKLILACSIAGIVPNFTLECLLLPPFASQNAHKIKPTKEIVQQELKRRCPDVKKLSKLKLEGLLGLLRSTNKGLTDECIVFIKNQFNEYKNLFQHMYDEQ